MPEIQDFLSDSNKPSFVHQCFLYEILESLPCILY